MLEQISNKTFLIIALVIFVAGGYYYSGEKIQAGEVLGKKGIKAIVYKSSTCGCCLEHAEYMEGEGFDVKTIVENDMNSVKQKYNIPYDMQSCHTTIISSYFIEGHVPIEAITKLLTEKPDIDGITLPDMPAGSPGMPGVKRGEFIIYSLKNGVSSEYMKL